MNTYSVATSVLLFFLTSSPALSVHECGKPLGSCLSHTDETIRPTQPKPPIVIEPAPLPTAPVDSVKPSNPVRKDD